MPHVTRGPYVVQACNNSLINSLESTEQILSLAVDGRCKNILCEFEGRIMHLFLSQSLNSSANFKCWAAFPFIVLSSLIGAGSINSSKKA